ncbi:MAG: beta-ketoacyl-ACP synthase III [Lachnospiraceae bacterium]|nr:beta-ketoacyl-ACP synthase III [Lachnospiraceae bacterium]
MRLRIRGTGSALPAHCVTNDELSRIMDTSDEWIVSRTGIHSRHISHGETTTHLCVQASRRALADAGMDAEELELIIAATVSPDDYLPNTGCAVQSAIGAVHAVAMELNAACAGFLFALNTVQAYIQAGIYRKALVIGGEVLSKMVDWEDRSTCVLFGDGAGAAVVEAAEEGYYFFCQGSDGRKGNVLSCRNRRVCNPFVSEEKALSEKEKQDYVRMDGREVFRFAVRTVPEAIREVLQQGERTVEEVDWFLLHQANERIISAVAKRLKVSEEKFPMNLDHCGNTSAASIPILLDEVNKKGLLKRGQTIVLSGFGAGLTWGAALLKW